MQNYTGCDIVGVNFPFFSRNELDMVRYRPCVALYGVGASPLYFAVYDVGDAFANGTPEKTLRDWEILLTAPKDIAPDYAPNHLVDVSKVCCLPDKIDFPGLFVHRMQTWKRFYVRQADKQRNTLAPVHPSSLRQQIVTTLGKLLQQQQSNPPAESSSVYFDSTIEYDNGCWIEHRFEKDDDEGWCTQRWQYNNKNSAPPPS